MRRHRVDGLLVSLSKNTDNFDHFDQLKKYNIPIVYFDRVPETPDSFTVSCNLKDSSVKLVDWLVSRGHKQIGFIKGPDSMLQAEERYQGYLEGLKENKLKVNPGYIVQTDLDKENTMQAIAQLLKLEQRPTAVIAFNDYIALDAIKYCREHGLKVNKDIFFVSYANLPMTSYLDDPPLASVEQFPYEQAEKATTMLLQLINDKTSGETMEKKIVLDSRVIINDSINTKP
jgi:LacI family transcriptional regulator, repressor for deo operon, udp, cdd, tsx, nupC, and nupG